MKKIILIVSGIVLFLNGFQLKKMIDSIFPATVKEKIRSIVEPMAFVQKKTANNVKRTAKNLSYGYVYLDVDDNKGTIPSDLFHHLKKLPGVIQIFSNHVPKEEVESFCNNVGLKLQESEIVFEIESVHEEKVQKLVQEVNHSETYEERRKAEIKLENELINPTCHVEKAKKLQTLFTNDVLVKLKEKRGRIVGEIRVSLRLILKAMKVMECRIGRNMIKEQIQSERFLIDMIHIYSQLKEQGQKEVIDTSF